MIKDKLLVIKLFLLELFLFNVIYGSPVNKKIDLKGDDVLYDKIYVDNGKFNIPCLRIDIIEDDKNMDQIGLFFNYEINPIANTKYVNYISNNSLKFDQKNGLLLLNGENVIGETFNSQNLELSCINQYENLYVVIKDEKNGTIYWRYPELDKKKSISSLKKEKLFVGESLYDERLDKHFDLTKDGFKINDKYIYSVPKEDDADLLEYIYLEKVKDYFIVQFGNSNNKNINNTIQVENVFNADFAELRYEESYGYYIIDSYGNILKKAKAITYDDNNNKFSIGKKLHVGDSITAKNGIVCAKLGENFELHIGEKTFKNISNIEIKSDIESPLTIDGVAIFKNFNKKMKKIGKLPSSMSLRCDQNGSNNFLAIYNDDTNEVIDEVVDKCRINEKLISNTDYNRDLCLNDSLVGSNGLKCLSYQKNDSSKKFELLDANNKTIYTNSLLDQHQPSSFYLEDDTGNFVALLGDKNLVLLNVNSPKVQMTCNTENEIVINTRDEKKELIWKYRPNTNVCTNGLESDKNNNQNIDCSKIYKLESIQGFSISKTTLGEYYNDNILQLSIEDHGVVKYNGKYELFRDEWNLNKPYDYAIKCDNDNPSNCKFINLFTYEVVKDLNSKNQIQTTFNPNNENEEEKRFKMGQKIMCKSGNYGLILNSEGFIYRTTENNRKVELMFEGDEDYDPSQYKRIVDAYFDEDYNFVLNYSYGSPLILVNYVNNFKNNRSSKKDIRISCNDDNGKIEFYEVYNNEKKVYFEYPKPEFITTVTTKYSTSYSTKYSTIYSTKTQTGVVTTTKPSYETYAYVSYYGTVGSQYLLGVNDLREYTTLSAKNGGILNKNASKYIRWLVKSIKDTPSKMYLANKNGGISNYCLDVGKASGDSYYLSITKCSNTKYLFKYYNVPFTDRDGLKINHSPIIAVYKNANTLFTNSKGIPYCIYYSETLYVKECKFTKNYPNYKWGTVNQKTASHTHTSTKTETRTTTKYSTTSTVKSSVITSVIPSVFTTVIPATSTQVSYRTVSSTTYTNNAVNSKPIPVTFKGLMNGDQSMYLSVPSLDVNEFFDMSTNDKYYTWFITSENKPSYIYLSDGVNGKVGNPTNYCLDLGENTSDQGFNYLNIVKCSEAKHKFMYDSTFTKYKYATINVYDLDEHLYYLNDYSLQQLCVYYSMTPRVNTCDDPNKTSQLGWVMEKL